MPSKRKKLIALTPSSDDESPPPQRLATMAGSGMANDDMVDVDAANEERKDSSAADAGVRLVGTIPGAGLSSQAELKFIFDYTACEKTVNERPVFAWKETALWYSSQGCWMRTTSDKIDDDGEEPWLFGTWRSQETDAKHPKDAGHWYFYDGVNWSPTTLKNAEDESQICDQAKDDDDAPAWIIAKAIEHAADKKRTSDADWYRTLYELNRGSASDSGLGGNDPNWSLLDVITPKELGCHTPLTWACSMDRVCDATKLIEQCADLNRENGAGSTALLCAVESNAERCVELLLDKNADTEVTTSDGKDIWELTTSPDHLQRKIKGVSSEEPHPSADQVSLQLRKEQKVYEPQKKVGEALAKRIQNSYGGSDVFKSKFNNVEFLVVTHVYKSIRNQTRRRLVDLRPGDSLTGLCEESEASRKVITYENTCEVTAQGRKLDMDLVDELVAKAGSAAHQRTLFVLVADECHFAAGQEQSQKAIVCREDLWNANNIVVLLCSATPYVNLTCDSAVPERYAREDGSVVWVDGIRQRAWSEDKDGEPVFTAEVPKDDVFLNGDVKDELGSELNVVWWRDINPEPGQYQGLDDILQSSSMHPVLNLKRRWTADGRFEDLVKFGSQDPFKKSHMGNERPELLAVDYAFSLLCRKQNWHLNVIEGVVRACVVKHKTSGSKRHKQIYHDFWPALRILLLFELSLIKPSNKNVEDATKVVYNAPLLGYCSTVKGKTLDDMGVKAIAKAIQTLLKVCERSVEGQQRKVSLTDMSVDALCQDKPVLQVVRLPAVKKGSQGFWGVIITAFLVSARDLLAKLDNDELGPTVQFEIIRDLGDDSVQQTIRSRFFYDLQHAYNAPADDDPNGSFTRHYCQHATNKNGLCPCNPKLTSPDVPFRFHAFKPTEELLQDIRNGVAGSDLKRLRCAEPNCNHVHIKIESFADLVPIRPRTDNARFSKRVLLILVDKGKLGDTFPDTFQCMDMRARPDINALDTMVQELGRLCGYDDGSCDVVRPYALVCNELAVHLKDVTTLEDLISRKAKNGTVDSMISRRNRKKVISHKSLVTNLRRNFIATSSYDKGRSKIKASVSFSNGEKPRWHKRRFVLFGEPQIGKTAAIVFCIYKLREYAKELVNGTVMLDNNEPYHVNEEEQGNSSLFPCKSELAKSCFMHNKRDPRNGAYGDPACDAVWEHYQRGGEAAKLPSELRESGKGGRGVASKSSGGPAASKPQQRLAAGCTNMLHIPNYPGSGNPSEPKRDKVRLQLANSRFCTIHIAALQKDCWDLTKKNAPKLVSMHVNEYCQLPIFMLTYKAGVRACLDIGSQFVNRAYIQIVCIYPLSVIGKDKYEEYLHDRKFENISFCEYPWVDGDVDCVGYSRHWVHRIAKAVCTPDRHHGRFYVMHDDNIKSWQRMDLQTGLSHAVCFSEVLKHFEKGLGLLKDNPVQDMRDIAMFGFHTLQKAEWEHSDLIKRRSSYGRRHCFKVVIMNLGILEAYDFQSQMHAMEDLDFNLRVSGKKRMNGGDSLHLEANDSQIISHQEKTVIEGPTDQFTSPIICKCQLFAFTKDPERGDGGAPKLLNRHWASISQSCRNQICKSVRIRYNLDTEDGLAQLIHEYEKLKNEGVPQAVVDQFDGSASGS